MGALFTQMTNSAWMATKEAATKAATALSSNYPIVDYAAVRVFGINVALHDVPTTLNGEMDLVVSCEPYKQRLVMAPETFRYLYDLDELRRRTGKARPVFQKLIEAIEQAGSMMKTVMVDVGPARAMKPKPKDASDRLDEIVADCGSLLAQMAAFGPGKRDVTEDQMAAFAGRYGELRDKIRTAREDLARAEGAMEVLQQKFVEVMT
jgi:hypothetical protein